MRTMGIALLVLGVSALAFGAPGDAGTGATQRPRVFAGELGTCVARPGAPLACWGRLPGRLSSAPPAGSWRSLVFDRTGHCALSPTGQLTCSDGGTADGVARVFRNGQQTFWQHEDGRVCVGLRQGEPECEAMDARARALFWESHRTVFSDGRVCGSLSRGCTPITVREAAEEKPAGELRAATQRCLLDAKGQVFCRKDLITVNRDLMAVDHPFVRLESLDGSQGLVETSWDVCGWTPRGAVRCVSERRRDASETLLPAVPVEGLACVEEVSSGAEHVCTVTCDGEVRCFLSNRFGQLGWPLANGPSQVALEGVTALEAGDAHVCALHGKGKVSCWGRNGAGQLGSPQDEVRQVSTVRAVELPAPAKALALGGDVSCALLQDRRLACWGENMHGIVHPGGPPATQKVRVLTELGAVDGVKVGDGHACASTAKGLRCWGRDVAGGDDKPSPRIIRLTSVRSLDFDTGNRSTCVVAKAGTVTCFDHVNGPPEGNSAPRGETIAGTTQAAKVVVGDDHACALDKQGKVSCWRRRRPTADSLPELDAVVALAVTQGSTADGTCAVRKEGDVLCWGDVPLGLWRSKNLKKPSPIPDLAQAVHFVLTEEQGCALHGDGKVTCVGKPGPALAAGDLWFSHVAIPPPAGP